MKTPSGISEPATLSVPEAEVISRSDPEFPVLLVCDHATNHIPAELLNLGLSAKLLASHIGWDIGAALVMRRLAELLRVPAVLCGCSRLVVDCNRNLDDPSAFPEVSDGIVVPGNAGLSASQRQLRADSVYWPYHHQVRDQLRMLENLVAAPALIAIHTFTPAMAGQKRPWHIGALWDKDSRISAPFMEGLRRIDGVVVGDNEPYSGRHPADFTLDHHAEAEGLAHLGIEVRQDLLTSEADVEHWAQRLAQVLGDILSDDALYTHRAGATE